MKSLSEEIVRDFGSRKEKGAKIWTVLFEQTNDLEGMKNSRGGKEK